MANSRFIEFHRHLGRGLGSLFQPTAQRTAPQGPLSPQQLYQQPIETYQAAPQAPAQAPPPPRPGYVPGGPQPNVGLQQLQQMIQLNADMRAGRTPRGVNTHPANMYAQGINTARNEVQADGLIGRPGMGLLRNGEAQDVYARGGHMPTMTVGGNWGQRYGDPVTPTMERNQIRLGQVNARLDRQPAAGPLVQRTPEQLDQRADAAGALVSQKRFNLPGTVLNEGSQNVAYGGTGRRVNYDPLTNQLSPTPEMRADMVRRGLLDQPGPDAEELAFRREHVANARSQEQGRRHGLIVANAQRESAQRDARMENRGQSGGLDINALAQRNPAFALGYMKLMQEGRTNEANQLLAQEQLKIERTKADAGMRLAEGNLALGERNAATGETEARNRGLTLDNEQKRLAQRDSREERQFAANQAQNHKANAIAQRGAGDFRGAQESERLAAEAEKQAGGQPGSPPIGSAAGQQEMANLDAFGSLDPAFREKLAATSPDQRAQAIKVAYPDLTNEQIDSILQRLAGGTASQFNPDGGMSGSLITPFNFWGLAGDNYARYFGNEPSPKVPYTSIPMPGLPGLPGIAQRMLGY